MFSVKWLKLLFMMYFYYNEKHFITHSCYYPGCGYYYGSGGFSDGLHS